MLNYFVLLFLQSATTIIRAKVLENTPILPTLESLSSLSSVWLLVTTGTA